MTRLLNIFRGMHQRCSNPNDPAYPRYGGRGITVDQCWSDFEIFGAWALQAGYMDTLTIDRIDGSKGYHPSNCRWATYQVQARNRAKKTGGSSQFIGVSWYPRNKKWSASVFVDKRNKYLGLFDTEEAAARARDAYIVENNLHGFKLNFP